MNLATRVVVLLSLATTSAHADDFSDFRIPEHHVLGLNAGTAFTGTRSSASQSPFTFRSRDLTGSISGSAFMLVESDRNLTRLSLATAMQVERRGDGSTYDVTSPPDHRIDSRSTDSDEIRANALLSALRRIYPFRQPVGFEFSVSGAAYRTQVWGTGNSQFLFDSPLVHRVSTSRTSGENALFQYDFDAGVGIGLGRVRDATGVYRARTLEQRLMHRGLLVRPLSSHGAQRLADLFYLRSDFEIHDRPAKYFWQEVERILVEDGALAPGGMNAGAVLRALEPEDLVMDPWVRLAGVFAGLRVDGIHSHQIRRGTNHEVFVSVQDTFPPFVDDYVSNQSFTGESNTVYVGPTAEIRRPIGLRWQLDASSLVQAPVPNDPIRSGLIVRSSALATWSVADRWAWTGYIDHNRRYLMTNPGVAQTRDDWSVRYGTSLTWFIEDRLEANLVVSEFQRSGIREFSPDPGSRYEQRYGRIELGFNYRLLGRHEAPGLIQPGHLNPGGMD